MNPRSLVSCILIFLNAERFMVEAVESIFAQTCDTWELLLVDDGSTDGSTEIARRYAQQNPGRVRYLEHAAHQNLGMSASRNLGVHHARGDRVAFLDADDVWLPAKLEEQAAVLRGCPQAAMVYGRTLIWHSWTGKPEDQQRDHTFPLGVPPETLVEPPNLFFLLLRNKVQTPTTCNFMIRREAYASLGGFEPGFRGMYEDQVFYAKVQLKMPVFVSGACWAKYRQHAGSCSSIAAGVQGYCQGRSSLLDWLAQYLPAQGYGRETRVYRALQREIWLCRRPRLHRLYDTLLGAAQGVTTVFSGGKPS